MDIIDFLRREQISLARAQRASCSTERRRHEEQAGHDGDRLRLVGFPHRPYFRRGRAFMITQAERIGFYREWSSRAARQALSAAQRQAKDRCAHSAGMWTLIADALEAGDDQRVASLTHNLTYLRPNYLIPAI